MKEVKSPKKPLIFYYGIVLLALVLGFLMILSPWLSFQSLNFVLGIYLILLGVDCVVEACSRIGGHW